MSKKPQKQSDGKKNIDFSAVVKWTIYVLALILVIVFCIIPLLAIMLAPLFSSDADLSGFQKMLDASNIALVFASLFLGGISVHQAKQSEKQTNIVLDKLDDIRNAQNIKTPSVYEHQQADISVYMWGKNDTTGENE